MDLQVFGRLVILAGGAFLIGQAARQLKEIDFGRLVLALAFGGLLAGTGTFGLPFMDKYKDYFDDLTKLIDVGDASAYAAFFNQVADDELPTEVAAVGLALTLERPVPEMGVAIEEAIQRAENPRSVELLERTKASLEAKEAVAKELVEKDAASGELSTDRIKRYDPATQRLMAEKLEGLPTHELHRFRIERRDLVDLSRAGQR